MECFVGMNDCDGRSQVGFQGLLELSESAQERLTRGVEIHSAEPRSFLRGNIGQHREPEDSEFSITVNIAEGVQRI